MYTREVLGADRAPVENGRAVQGTWAGSLPAADLRAVERPFAAPLPGVLAASRLKEWQSFIVQNDDVYLEAEFANLAAVRAARLFFFDKTTRQTLRAFAALPFRSWRLPARLDNAALEDGGRGLRFKIHCWLDAEVIRLDLRTAARPGRPPLTAQLEFDLGLDKSVPFGASLLFTGRRGLYVRKMLCPARGKIKLDGTPYRALHRRSATGIFRDYRGFWPYRTRARWCNACGVDEAGRRFGFSLGETPAQFSRRDNENAFWRDGRLSLLPPVRVTPAADVEAGWVIQDLEGLVDLAFTPEAPCDGAINALVAKARLSTPLGFFNGMIKSADGEEFPVRRLWGNIEDIYLRM